MIGTRKRPFSSRSTVFQTTTGKERKKRSPFCAASCTCFNSKVVIFIVRIKARQPDRVGHDPFVLLAGDILRQIASHSRQPTSDRSSALLSFPCFRMAIAVWTVGLP